LRIIAENDKRIRTSFENKKLGGYISLLSEISNHNEDEELEKEIEFKFDMIFNSMGFLQNGSEIWNGKFVKLKLYIDTNKKIPNCRSKNSEEKRLGLWVFTQKQNYQKKTQIMKDETIYNTWTKFIAEYKEYFVSNEELWNGKFFKLKSFIDTNKKTPKSESKNSDEKGLGQWISHQKDNYQKKTYIMKDETIYNTWTKFIAEYKEYFLSNEEIWNNNLIKLKSFIDTNKKIPNCHSKNSEEKRLGLWVINQKQNYQKKTQIMKDETIYNTWTKFIAEYKEYFVSNEELWNGKFFKLKSFIDTKKKAPNCHSKNSDEKGLGQWISHQKKNYQTKAQIMKDETIYNTWTKFIAEYKEYFNKQKIKNHRVQVFQ
jgi:hypothetical protein